jgi:hypothetical protein
VVGEQCPGAAGVGGLRVSRIGGSAHSRSTDAGSRSLRSVSPGSCGWSDAELMALWFQPFDVGAGRVRRRR